MIALVRLVEEGESQLSRKEEQLPDPLNFVDLRLSLQVGLLDGDPEPVPTIDHLVLDDYGADVGIAVVPKVDVVALDLASTGL